MSADELTVRELFEELLDNRQLSLRLGSEEEARYVYNRISSFRSKWNKRLVDLGLPADAGVLRIKCSSDEATGECIATITYAQAEETRARIKFRVIRTANGENLRTDLGADQDLPQGASCSEQQSS